MPSLGNVRIRAIDEPVVAVGLTYTPPLIVPPHQVSGVAYATGDAIGEIFEIPNVVRPGPRSGVLHSAHLIDLSAQGIACDVILFRGPFTWTADNGAFNPADTDFIYYVGAISFSTFKTWGTNQVSDLVGIGMAFNCVGGVGSGTSLYGQLVSRGTPTVAANSPYELLFTALLD